MCRIRLLAWKFIQYFLKRTLHLICQSSIELTSIYVHSFESSKSKWEKWRFVHHILLLSSQTIFRMLEKANAFWMILEALVREIDVRG
jgi:hypothetical protein